VESEDAVRDAVELMELKSQTREEGCEGEVFHGMEMQLTETSLGSTKVGSTGEDGEVPLTAAGLNSVESSDLLEVRIGVDLEMPGLDAVEDGGDGERTIGVQPSASLSGTAEIEEDAVRDVVELMALLSQTSEEGHEDEVSGSLEKQLKEPSLSSMEVDEVLLAAGFDSKQSSDGMGVDPRLLSNSSGSLEKQLKEPSLSSMEVDEVLLAAGFDAKRSSDGMGVDPRLLSNSLDFTMEGGAVTGLADGMPMVGVEPSGPRKGLSKSRQPKNRPLGPTPKAAVEQALPLAGPSKSRQPVKTSSGPRYTQAKRGPAAAPMEESADSSDAVDSDRSADGAVQLQQPKNRPLGARPMAAVELALPLATPLKKVQSKKRLLPTGHMQAKRGPAAAATEENSDSSDDVDSDGSAHGAAQFETNRSSRKIEERKNSKPKLAPPLKKAKPAIGKDGVFVPVSFSINLSRIVRICGIQANPKQSDSRKIPLVSFAINSTRNAEETVFLVQLR